MPKQTITKQNKQTKQNNNNKIEQQNDRYGVLENVVSRLIPPGMYWKQKS